MDTFKVGLLLGGVIILTALQRVFDNFSMAVQGTLGGLAIIGVFWAIDKCEKTEEPGWLQKFEGQLGRFGEAKILSVHRALAVGYSVFVLVTVLYVPWLSRSGYRSGFAFLFSPPSRVATIDHRQVLLELIAVTAFFGFLYSIRSRFEGITVMTLFKWVLGAIAAFVVIAFLLQ